MKKIIVIVMLTAAAAAMVCLTAAPASADQIQQVAQAQAQPGQEPGVKETEAKPQEYCGICEAKRNVNQLVPWLNWGFDVRLREEYLQNPALTENSSSAENLWLRVRPRLWVQARPVEDLDLSINARIVWEYWYITKPDSSVNSPDTQALFDDLNVHWGKICDTPLSVTIGRQQMRFGDGWLIFEGTQLDGSRTVFFDAARFTYDASDEMNTIFDAIYVEDRANTNNGLVPAFNDIGPNASMKANPILPNNQRGIILYAQNKSVQSTQIDAYFIYFHEGTEYAGFVPGGFGNGTFKPLGTSIDGTFADIYTVGARVAGDMTDNLQGRIEAAVQFGNQNDESMCGAWGMNSQLTYNFHDENQQAVWAGLEVRSGGEDPNENFNILWGTYPQWSDLYNGYVDTKTGESSPAESPNIIRPYVGYGLTPACCKALSFQFNYHLLFCYNNNMSGLPGFSSGQQYFRGQLVTALMKYQFCEHIAGHLQGEGFFPGNFYEDSNNDPAWFARYELVFTW